MRISGLSLPTMYNSTITNKNRTEIHSVRFSANPIEKNIPKKTLISLLMTGYAGIMSLFKKDKNDISESDRYIDIRDKYSKIAEPVLINANKARWNYFTNSSLENCQLLNTANKNVSSIYISKTMYDSFKDIDKTRLSSHEAKQLEKILKIFDEANSTDGMLQAIDIRKNQISQKYNNYTPVIDGQKMTQMDIVDILLSETNPDLRRKAYEAKIKGGDLIADDLIELVKMRNEYAKTKGYDNYFDYMVKERYGTASEFLDKLTDDVYSKTQTKISALLEKNEKELKEFFGAKELKPYHYGMLLNSNPEKEVHKIISNQSIEDISKKIYAGMGYDIDKLQKEGKLTLDLYPREGKHTHGLCFEIEAGKDVRVLANLANNLRSLNTLNHELGHSIYSLGLSPDLTLTDRTPASAAATEAIAVMMSNIIKTEDVLKGIVPDELLTKFKNSLKDDKAFFISKSLMTINFERELYRNPDQNPAELWAKMRGKYLNRHEEAGNEWATIPHYLTHPGYYQNYFRAMLMSAQIYNHLHKVLGNITENSKTAEYMNKNIFAIGASVDEYDLIKQLTGKEFGVDDFAKGL